MSPRTLLWLGPPLAALLLWALTLAMPAPQLTVAFGREGLNPFAQGTVVDGFLGWGSPETPGGKLARRAEPTARLTIPWAWRLADTLQIDLVANGWGAAGPVQLALNGTSLAFPTPGGWQQHTLLLPHQPTLYEADLFLEWQSTGAQGPLLHQITLRPHGPPAGWLAGPLWLAGALALVVWLGRRQPLGGLALWCALLTASALAGRLLSVPHVLPWALLVALGGAAAAVLTWLEPRPGRRALLWALVLWLLAAPQVLGHWVLDDAFISFRYAQNLVAGHALTFNPTDAQPVEGYTNFLWVLLAAGALALGLEPVLWAQATCTVLALATLLLTYGLARRWLGGLALLPPLWLASMPAFVLYTARGSGMETALVALLTLAALALLAHVTTLRGGLLAGLICALLTMSRPDGALVPLAGGLLLLGRVWWLRAAPDGWRAALLPLVGLVVGFALLYGPYFAWRFSYYGFLLPNTFYAKTGATVAQVLRGADYARTFLGGLANWAWPGLLALLLAALWAGRAQRWALLLGLFVLLHTAYIVLVGGDQFPLGRFFVPLLPVLALLAGLGAARLWAATRLAAGRALLLVVLAVLLLGTGLGLPASDRRIAGGAVWREHTVTLKNADLGHWLRRHTPPNTVVATGIAGALPYYAERHVIDMLGLNDVHIAHVEVATLGQGIAGAEKTDLGYVLDQQPDYIPFASSGSLLDNARFRRSYELVTVYGPRGGDIRLYRRLPDAP